MENTLSPAVRVVGSNMKWTMRILLLVVELLFVTKVYSQASRGSRESFLTKNCPIFGIKAETHFLKKSSTTYGQGWYFTVSKDKPTVSKGSISSLENEHYILTPYHVIAGARNVEAQCPYSQASWELEIVGSSPSYDMSVLKIVKAVSSTKIHKKDSTNFVEYQHHPLFRLNSKGELIQKNFPLDERLKTTLSTNKTRAGNSGAFFAFVMHMQSENFLEWISAGPLLQGWNYDETGLAPFSKAIMPLSGVQPGMSGGLLLTAGSQPQLLGMIMGLKFNRGESLVAPFDEIISLLPLLLRGQDPHRMKHQGLSSYIKYSMVNENNQLMRGRNLYWTKKTSENDQEELLASEPCYSNQSPFHNSAGWGGGATTGDSGGGASHGDSGGGATTGDSGGGATYGDSAGATIGDAGGEGENVKASIGSNHFLPIAPQFSTTLFDWFEYVGWKRFYARSVFQKENLCRKEGVLWLPENKTLVGIKFKNFTMSINSVKDLIYLEEKLVLNKEINESNLDLKSWVRTYGVFESDLLHQGLNQGNYIIENLCSSSTPLIPNVSQNGLLRGTNLLLYPHTQNLTSNPMPIGISRIYEDYQTLPIYKEYPQGYINKFGLGYFCEKNLLLVVGTNLKSTYSSNLFNGNS